MLENLYQNRFFRFGFLASRSILSRFFDLNGFTLLITLHFPLISYFLVYTGFIYNDIFSKSINIFGPKWEVSKQPGLEGWLKSNSTPDDATITLNPNFTQTGMTHTDDSYIHMTYIFLSYMNHRYFGVSFWQNNYTRW